ncbi:MAG: AIR synthase-related protein [Elusimicrobiota bacterium]
MSLSGKARAPKPERHAPAPAAGAQPGSNGSDWENPWIGAPGKNLAALNARYGWALTEAELKAVQDHFTSLRREPTRAEAETIARIWSERCRHKTFTGPIRYQDGKSTTRYKNLLADTIMAATQKLRRPWCLSALKDNAGVVAFDKEWSLAYKVETHNRPCAIEPHGGAGAGVGSVMRDILATGLGAKPILNTDVLCFCPPDYAGPLPKRVLHPRRMMTDVVAGVRDYGNRLGIPTAAGAIWFDEGYRFNPLVFVGTVGIMPNGTLRKSVVPGDLIAAVGGRTGRDGFPCAAVSSSAAAGPAEADTAAVRIGHATMGKRLLDALLKARDKRLYRSVTDCGAGGFSVAIAEMARGAATPSRGGRLGGARVRLENALLKTPDIEPWEVWVSESQERMVLAVPKKNLKSLAAVVESEGVELCVLGEFTDTGRIEVGFGGRPLLDLDLGFLRDGLPRPELRAVWNPPPKASAKRKSRSDGRARCAEALHWALAHLNVCSREWVIRQYDHEVQSGTVIKPLQGLHHDGPGDACVIWPAAVTGDAKSHKGVAVAHGINPAYGKLDPYAMALACVGEALSNLACVGADVTRAALLDNFCWGAPDDPHTLGALVRAAQGCRDAALGFQAPFISGNDSLHNVYSDGKRPRRSIPGTLLISAVAPVPDIRRALTMDFKAPGNPVYIMGETADEMRGTIHEAWSGTPQGRVPTVEPRSAKKALWALSAAAQKGLITTAHNLAEGGLAVAAAEMAFAGEVSVHIDLDMIPRAKGASDEATLLFSESPSRFLLEIAAEKEKAFLKAMRGVPLARIGSTIANPVLRITGLDGRQVLEEGLQELKASWRRTLPRMLDGSAKDRRR